MTSANYTDGIGTGYTSHDNEMCLHITDFKATLNQSIKSDLCDAVMKRVRGRGKKAEGFPPPKQVKN